MDRTKKLKWNTFASLINRLIVLLSSMVLPRLILIYYGSEVNGILSSITQFLGVITFLDLGVGGVIQAALFQPLANKNDKKISEIIISANSFLKKIAFVLVIYIIILIFTFPNFVDENIDKTATILLIIAISISQFAQYYFGIVNELLLNADQKAYIQLFSEMIAIILNFIFSLILIKNNFSIVLVKLVTSLVYVARPIYLKYYVDKNYNISYSIEVTEDSIKNKWDGMVQHMASFVLNGSDVIVLTIFSSIENVSVYVIYNMVINGVKTFISSLLGGIHAFFGNLIATKEFELLNSYFARIEWLVHTTVVFLFGMTAVLITPFVMIYTKGITDANYYAPIFAFILVIAQAIYIIRLPYFTMIVSAGHYRQMQSSAIIEVIINLVLSISLVLKYGLVGVAIGTLAAMVYRTIYFVFYLSKNIVYRSVKIFFKNFAVDLLTFLIFLGVSLLIKLEVVNILQWITLAVTLGILYLIIILTINLVFYKETTIYYIRKVLKRT